MTSCLIYYRSMIRCLRGNFCFLMVTLLLIIRSPGYAQSAPTVLTQGAVVIGQCSGHTSEPGCVPPNLFGPTGLTLCPTTQCPHFAHFIGSAQAVLNQTLSSAIAT